MGSAFGKLEHILKNTDIPMNMKRKVYDKCILSVRTCRLETTTLIRQSADRLRVAYRSMERAKFEFSFR